MYKQTIRPVLFLMEPERYTPCWFPSSNVTGICHGANAGYVISILVPTNS